MHNKYRGEISAKLDGQDCRLCLSLGALAEFETAFGEEDMIALASRFETGRLKASDAIRVIGAGLRGAGHDVSDEAVAAMRSDDGAGGYVAIVVRLLEATFGSSESDVAKEANNSDAPREEGRTAPFPGTT